jgi:hypothetical protein
MRLFAAVAAFLTAITGTALAEQPCDLQGAWELVCSTLNNVPGPSTVTSRKIFSKTRFAVIANDIRYSGPLLGPHEVLTAWWRSADPMTSRGPHGPRRSTRALPANTSACP